MEYKKIINVNSSYVVDIIFSHITYGKALKLAKYNKRLQRQLNISFNDYFIECTFEKDYKAIGDDYVWKIYKEKDNCFMSYSIIILQIFFISLILINIKFWKTNFYYIFLIIDIIYKSVFVFYLFMKKFFKTVLSESFKSLNIFNIIANSILLIILICKLVSEKKRNNYKKNLLILNSITICACIILIIFFSIYTFYCIDIYINRFDRLEPKHKKEIYIAIINKFQGFNINKYKYTSLKEFGKINESDVTILIKYLSFTIKNDKKQNIQLINKLRNKKHLKVLKYEQNQKLSDFFIYYKQFGCLLSDINEFNNNYLFILPKNDFKKRIIQNEKKTMQILYKNCFDHIMIFEKDSKEYILIYKPNSKKKININEQINSEMKSKDLLIIDTNIK